MQLLTYVQTKRITAWKNMVLKSGVTSMVYGSKDARLFAKLKKGDILWVISAFPSRKPALTAKLVVDSVGDENCASTLANPNAAMLLRDPSLKFKWVAIGGSGSCFYGFNDAGKALLDLPFVTSGQNQLSFREKEDEWQSTFGHYLQRPIQIADKPGENALEKHARHCEALTVFISWKHSDHPQKRLPLQITYALVNEGLAVRLDILALPPSRYLKEIRRDQQVLANLLQYGYKQSQSVLALDSACYATKTDNSARNWTKDEWDGIMESNVAKQRFTVPIPEGKKSGISTAADNVIQSSDPAQIASAVSQSIRSKYVGSA